ncbi:hypothetical protein PMAYCL1PPCAC_13178, partial [Pristionchus mayeri]
QLTAAVNRWFDSSSADPVVVVIYSSGTELLEDLASSTSSFLGKDTSIFRATDRTTRAVLHDAFETGLNNGPLSSIGIQELEKLSWEAALVLHYFADGDYASDSRPLMWLQVTLYEKSHAMLLLKGFSSHRGFVVEATKTTSRP